MPLVATCRVTLQSKTSLDFCRWIQPYVCLQRNTNDCAPSTPVDPHPIFKSCGSLKGMATFAASDSGYPLDVQKDDLIWWISPCRAIARRMLISDGWALQVFITLSDKAPSGAPHILSMCYPQQYLSYWRGHCPQQ